jgi:archaemetzincin
MAFNRERGQYYAPKLLSFLINKDRPAIWIVDEDIYASGMNFIFGLASYKKGAVVSSYRLDDQLIAKETIHEVGHVLGLKHCSNECVMRFSNSVMEARMKPMKLCDECKEKLKKKAQVIRSDRS